MSSPQSYRPDIDGLRALAVVPVVLFHVGTRGFFGGFVGVDVFFVISGYLISRIIVGEIDEGRFSLATFYRRRALRILPALTVMLAVSAGLAYAALLPSELVRFGQSLLATALFGSNFYFAQHAGYFAPAAHAAPLLHTWSLAVEEQFYLLWPLVLMLLARLRLWSMRLTLTVLVAVASFAGAVALLKSDPVGTFYGPHLRAWELMVGALAAMIDWRGLMARRWLRELFAAAGALAILYAIKFYNQATPFPGAAALAPVLGAAAIIVAGSGASGTTVVGRVLAWQPLVWIGKISFSLYLWHWPVIVYSQLAIYQEQTTAMKVVLVAVSVLLGALSWKFVETPFRRGLPTVSTPTVLWRSAGLVTAFVALAGTVVLRDGFPGRLDPAQQAIAAFAEYPGDQVYRGGECFVVQPGDAFDERRCLAREPGRPALLVVGDSHAAHLWPGLSAVATGVSVLQATSTGCRPLIEPTVDGEAECRRFFRHVLAQWLPQHPVDTLVLAGRWNDSDLRRLPETLQALQPYARQVVVVGPVPQYASALPRLLVHAQRVADAGSLSDGLVKSQFDLDRRLRVVVAGTSATYFSALDALCDKSHQCRTLAREGVPLQYDYGHFTSEGSVALVGELMAALHP